MFTRLAVLLLALLVSGQAALAAGSERVCRYTGRRMPPCAACPGKKQAGDTRLLAQDCCELRQGHPVDPAGPPSVLDVRSPFQQVALPGTSVWALPAAPVPLGLRPRSGQDPPPRPRLFLSLRQWLI